MQCPCDPRASLVDDALLGDVKNHGGVADPLSQLFPCLGLSIVLLDVRDVQIMHLHVACERPGMSNENSFCSHKELDSKIMRLVGVEE